ncbi:hypothetical protein B0H21DRAFT_719117 [Amylocystis lapponica]|nr:hypothetical protein B0H21DRAFT_719117 [Amylocystis lapponica]
MLRLPNLHDLCPCVGVCIPKAAEQRSRPSVETNKEHGQRSPENWRSCGLREASCVQRGGRRSPRVLASEAMVCIKGHASNPSLSPSPFLHGILYSPLSSRLFLAFSSRCLTVWKSPRHSLNLPLPALLSVSTSQRPSPHPQFHINMFATVSFISLALSAVSAVSGLAVPLRRDDVPATYDQNNLEPYDQYHARYLALDCEANHGNSFFDSCCHPIPNGQTLSERLPQCNPWGSSSSMPAPAPSTTADASSTPAPAPSLTAEALAASSSVYTGGATYFYQDGNAGACGNVHSDSDFIAALVNQDRYGDSGEVSSLCGKKVNITNVSNGKSVTVAIADDCPTCENSNSIDLSVAAFKKLATLEEGEVNIKWSFV